MLDFIKKNFTSLELCKILNKEKDFIIIDE